MSRAWPVVGRDDELGSLSRGIQYGPGAVVVVGAAGVGKSRLVSEFLQRIAADGWRTVLVRATRSTATIPFGPFVPWCPVDPTSPAPADRWQVLRAVSAALLDGDGPLVVAVDDAYLLDEPSAALVLYLAAHTPARVVVTVRAGERCPDAVVALWKESLADRIDLKPLSETQVAELVGRVLDGAVGPSVHSGVWGISEGTPLYVREVLHAAQAQGVLARCGGAWRWQGELTGNGRLGELMLDRVAHLGPGERRVLDLVAVGEPLPVDIADQTGCLRVVAELEDRGLVTVTDGDDGDLVRLAHPLYGELLRAGMPRLTGRTHQRDLAKAAVAVGWHRRDPLRVASWWAEGGAAAGPADVFLLAARRALTIGEWELATRHAEAAAASGAVEAAVLVKAAAAVHLGGWGEVGPLLGEVASGSLDAHMLAEHARLWAGFLSWSKGHIEAGRDVLVDAAGRLEPPGRAHALAGAAYIALLACHLDDAINLATEAMNEAGPSTEARVAAMAVAAAALALEGKTGAALQLARMSEPYVGNAVTADPYPDSPAGVLIAAHCLALILAGRIDDAGALAGAALAPHTSCRLGAGLTVTATLAGHVALLRGHLIEAQRWGREALPKGRPGPGSQWPATVLAKAGAQLGDAEAASAALALAASTSPLIPLVAPELVLAHGWAQVARGDLAAARRTAARAAAVAADSGASVFEMLALLDLVRLGGAASAARRLAELAHVIEGPFAAGCAAYARAAAEGDGAGLDQVSCEFEAMGARLVAAEAAAGAASAHRSAGLARRDRASRSRAKALAARCPADTPGLRELAASPGLPPLTRREREVAELAGRGLTNRGIAKRLHVSVRTVNAHLGHVYTKLGTSDRAQLATLLPPSSTRS